MVTYFLITFFVLGLIIGSFLNVVIYRLNSSRSLGGRSACMSCKKHLAWYELVPVFSFILLAGRCKSCKTKISWQYPLVELSSGFIFALMFWKFQDLFSVSIPVFAFTYAYYVVMFSVLLVIAVYDLRHQIIPDRLSLIFGFLSFVGLFLFTTFGFYPHIPSALEFLSGVFIAFPFAFLWLVSSGRWMGFGDAKLAIGLGWFLGFSLALSAITLAFWGGALVGIILIMFSKKYGMKSQIPFALYLVLGTLGAFIFNLNLYHIPF